MYNIPNKKILITLFDSTISRNVRMQGNYLLQFSYRIERKIRLPIYKLRSLIRRTIKFRRTYNTFYR